MFPFDAPFFCHLPELWAPICLNPSYLSSPQGEDLHDLWWKLVNSNLFTLIIEAFYCFFFLEQLNNAQLHILQNLLFMHDELKYNFNVICCWPKLFLNLLHLPFFLFTASHILLLLLNVVVIVKVAVIAAIFIGIVDLFLNKYVERKN